VKLQICSAEAFLTIKHKAFVLLYLQTELNSYIHAVDNTQQLFCRNNYLKKFVLAVVVALPSYMLYACKTETHVRRKRQEDGYQYNVTNPVAQKK
jgi:hypothetical protein